MIPASHISGLRLNEYYMEGADGPLHHHTVTRQSQLGRRCLHPPLIEGGFAENSCYSFADVICNLQVTRRKGVQIHGRPTIRPRVTLLVIAGLTGNPDHRSVQAPPVEPRVPPPVEPRVTP